MIDLLVPLELPEDRRYGPLGRTDPRTPADRAGPGNAPASPDSVHSLVRWFLDLA